MFFEEELIYSKRYPPAEEELEKFSADPTMPVITPEQGEASYREFCARMNGGSRLEPIPGREEKAREFIALAKKFSEEHEVDMDISRLPHSVNVSLHFYCAAYAVDMERIMEKRRKRQADSLRTAQKELQSLHTAQEQLSDQGQKLYEDFVEGTISRVTYNKQKAALTERQEEINRAETTVSQRINDLTASHDILIEKYRSLTELDNLTAEIAADLLNRVTIWPDGRMEVELNYLDEIELAF